jgi:manganese efflux pump family protein
VRRARDSEGTRAAPRSQIIGRWRILADDENRGSISSHSHRKGRTRMALMSVLLIALALAMDAFAVALSAGAFLVKVDARQTFRLSFHFGLFQFLMPVLGWLAGVRLQSVISAFDHWIAFGLLAIIGGKMIRSSFEDSKEVFRGDVTKGWLLVSLSVATSIDAFAVGLSLAVLDVGIMGPSVIIGIVAAALTLIGLRLGERLSSLLGKKMELIGGLILVGIGVRVVLEHLAVL